MAYKMGYVCSCGAHWDTSDWTSVESHMDVNTTHVISEGYFHDTGTGVPAEIPMRAMTGDLYRVQVDSSGGLASEGTYGQATKLPKSRQAVSTSPSVDDDETEGYERGSRWINFSLSREFLCVDASSGAAVWKETTGQFGLGHTRFSDTAEYSTTSSSWQSTTRFATEFLNNATYRVEWVCILRASRKQAYCQILVGESPIASGSAPSGSEMTLSGFWEGSLYGEVTFVAQHRSSSGSRHTSSRISNLNLTLWRVS